MTVLTLKKENKMLKYILLAILVINQSCNIEQKKITLGEYLKDKRITSIKIEASAKHSFYVQSSRKSVIYEIELPYHICHIFSIYEL